MPAIDDIRRLVKRHEQCVYTLRELLPLLVKRTPQENLADLKTCLPGEIWAPFVKWIQDYPLDGGIQIRDGEELPIEKIKWLKQATRAES
ncbi:MAG: hypothetical protein ACI9HK_003205 [Pirellulaceae bacterium]|jgi:hypothetical protein